MISPRDCLLAFALLAVGCGCAGYPSPELRTAENRLPEGSEKACGQGYPSEERAGGPCDHELNAAMCSDPFELACAIDDIMSSTRKCTDLHAGEYYGDWFKPIDS